MAWRPCRPRRVNENAANQGIGVPGKSANSACLPIFRHNEMALANPLLITGASQLLTLGGRGPRRGDSLSNIGLVKDGGLLGCDGVIAGVGTRAGVGALPEARAAGRIGRG